MSKHLHRIVAFLLVSCLLADPNLALALDFSTRYPLQERAALQNPFTTSALMVRVVSIRQRVLDHPFISRLIWPLRVHRLAGPLDSPFGPVFMGNETGSGSSGGSTGKKTSVFPNELTQMILEQPDIQRLDPRKRKPLTSIPQWHLMEDPQRRPPLEPSAANDVILAVARVNWARADPQWQNDISAVTGGEASRYPLGGPDRYTSNQLAWLKSYYENPTPEQGQKAISRLVEDKYNLPRDQADFIAGLVLVSWNYTESARALHMFIHTSANFIYERQRSDTGQPVSPRFLALMNILLEAGNLYYNIPGRRPRLRVHLNAGALKRTALQTTDFYNPQEIWISVPTDRATGAEVLKALALDDQPVNQIFLEIKRPTRAAQSEQFVLHPDEYTAPLGDRDVVFVRGAPYEMRQAGQQALVFLGKGVRELRRRRSERRALYIPLLDDTSCPLFLFIRRVGIHTDRQDKLEVRINTHLIDPGSYQHEEVMPNDVVEIFLRESPTPASNGGTGSGAAPGDPSRRHGNPGFHEINGAHIDTLNRYSTDRHGIKNPLLREEHRHSNEMDPTRIRQGTPSDSLRAAKIAKLRAEMDTGKPLFAGEELKEAGRKLLDSLTDPEVNALDLKVSWWQRQTPRHNNVNLLITAVSKHETEPLIRFRLSATRRGPAPDYDFDLLVASPEILPIDRHRLNFNRLIQVIPETLETARSKDNVLRALNKRPLWERFASQDPSGVVSLLGDREAQVPGRPLLQSDKKNHPENYVRLAVALFQLDRTSEGIVVLTDKHRHVRWQLRDYLPASLVLAELLDKTGQTMLAISLLQEALPRFPQDRHLRDRLTVLRNKARELGILDPEKEDAGTATAPVPPATPKDEGSPTRVEDMQKETARKVSAEAPPKEPPTTAPKKKGGRLLSILLAVSLLGAQAGHALFASGMISARPALQQAAALQSSNPSPQLRAYFEQLQELSQTDHPQLRSDASSPFFTTNEGYHDGFFKAVEGKGGAMLGVSFDQNFSLAVHGRPSVYFFIDINPFVTEVLVPFYGRLMELSRTRREFLSFLLSVNVTEQELQTLLKPGSQGTLERSRLLESLTFSEKLTSEDRAKRYDLLQAIFEVSILPHLPLDIVVRQQALYEFRKIFDSPIGGQQQLPNYHPLMDFLMIHSLQDWSGPSPAPRHHQTWFSTEENYRLTRERWLQGRFLGATGDVRGDAVQKIGNWLRPRGETVTSIYLSNVAEWFSFPNPSLLNRITTASLSDIRSMYENLAHLPTRPGTLILQNGYPRPAAENYTWSYAHMRWVYRYFGSENVSLLYKVMASLKVDSQWAPFIETLRNQVFPFSLREGSEGILRYRQLFEALRRPLQGMAHMTPEAFTGWAEKTFPGFDSGTAYFRAMVITLVEGGYLKPSPSETAADPKPRALLSTPSTAPLRSQALNSAS